MLNVLLIMDVLYSGETLWVKLLFIIGQVVQVLEK